ncbi:MAG: lipopolysaccharide biosynthesis protein [Bacteroidota bacterium]
MNPTEHKTYFKNFTRLFSGNLLGQLLPFIFAPIVARIYSPAEIAIQENFLTVVSLIGIVAMGRFEIAVVLEKNENRLNVLLKLCAVVLSGFIGISAVFSFFPEWIVQFFNSKEIAFHLRFLPLAIAVLGMLNLLTQWLLHQGKFTSLSASRIIQSFIQNAGYAFFGYLGFGVKGMLFAWIAGALLPVLILGVPMLKSVFSNHWSRSEMKSMAYHHKDFPMVNSLHAFTDILATQFLLFGIISHQFGITALGLFALTNRYLKAPLVLISGALSQLYYSEASGFVHQGRSIKPIYLRTIRMMLVVLIPFAIVIFFFGKDLFNWYLGPKWIEAGTITVYLIPVLVTNFICSCVSTTPVLMKQQKTAYVFSLVGYALGLGVLFVSSLYNVEFKSALLMYSFAMSLFYIVLSSWYFQLIAKFEHKVISPN